MNQDWLNKMLGALPNASKTIRLDLAGLQIAFPAEAHLRVTTIEFNPPTMEAKAEAA